MSLTAFGVDKFVTVHGLPLHYVEWGQPDAPSLVLGDFRERFYCARVSMLK
jgi:hypothetical protein